MNYVERVENLKMRYGNAIKTDKNGTLYFADYNCQRCGGIGFIDCFRYINNGICFECDGSGKSNSARIIKLYTDEYTLKLEERRQKKEAKKVAERIANADANNKKFLQMHSFDENGNWYVVLGNTYEIKDELKAAGAKFEYSIGWHFDHPVDYPTIIISVDEIFAKDAYDTYCSYNISNSTINKIAKANEDLHNNLSTTSSEYQGKIKDRLKGLTLTVVFTTTFEGISYSYYDSGIKYFYSMTDKNGNIFTWTTSSNIAAKGDILTLDATVKAHTEYKHEKQTVLTRCKIISVQKGE